jgi:hypothetical protein
MLSLLTRWISRPRVKYKPLDNSPLDTIEMADHTVMPANAHEARELSPDPRRFSHDVAGGELGQDAVHKPAEKGLPQYQPRPESVTTLNGNVIEDEITDEELAKLRRVADRIPLSAWLFSSQILLNSPGSSSLLNCANVSPTTG